jgi:predicted DNA-binding transcriptional regulator YafY
MNGLNKNALIRYKVIDDCLNNKNYWQRILNKKNYSNFYEGKRQILEHEEDRDLPNKNVFRIVLSEKFKINISDDQLDKDIRTLRNEFKAPIEYDSKLKGYYYKYSFTFQGENMNEDEINSIQFLYALTKNDLKFSSYDVYNKTIENIIKKLNKKFEYFDEKETNSISKYILKDDFIGNTGSEWIEKIYDSIIKNKYLIITYKRYEKEKLNKHILIPYLLKEYNKQWYLIGYSKLSKQIVTLALDRIHELQIEKNIPTKNSFNYKEFFKYSFGISNRIGSKPQNIKFAIKKSFQKYFVANKIHHSQINEIVNDELIVNIKCYITKELISKILSFGHNITIISPLELVEKINKEVDLIKKNYL